MALLELPAPVGPAPRAGGETPPPGVIELPPYEMACALALSDQLGVGHVLAQVLVRRGLGEPASARAFLDADEHTDPLALPGMADACAAVHGAIAAGRRITVHGDYDVDGVCATAIMVAALRGLGADVDWFLPSRLHDGYGLSATTVARLADRGTGLLLTVDCAVTAVEEVAAARAAGLSVVVSDHHAPRADGRLPDCPVVHPGIGVAELPPLCGAGVAHKLARALGAPGAEAELELVALATVADLVPLRGENRRLVRDGLRALALTARPGLRALMAVAEVDPGALDTSTLGFRLAPRINAAGRLARADAGLELLLCEDPVRARAIAVELDRVNAERRAIEQRIGWAAEDRVRAAQALARERGDADPPAYVLAGEDWHPGVIGIVASRVAEAHHRPTLMVAVDPATGQATGSGRSIPGFDLLGALHGCAPHLTRYGGHRAAAGFTTTVEAIDDLRRAFAAHVAEMLTPEMLAPVERVDAVVSGSELGLALAAELRALEPCGIGNPAPRLLVPGARIDDVRPMGEGRHARCSILSGGARAKAVAFGCDGRIGAGGEAPQDVSLRLEQSVFRGAVEPRAVLRRTVPAAPAAIRPWARSGAPYLEAVLRALEIPEDSGAGTGAAATAPPPGAPPSPVRRVRRRHGESPLAVLADACAAGPTLAVCADVARRLPGLRERSGGFTLAEHAELAGDPDRVAAYAHVVVLDPPADPGQAARLRHGAGVLHEAWGPAELRFTQQIHEQEYALRAPLGALYRALRERGRATGGELEALLRGEGPHGRPARLAARLIRVLAELDLVSLDRDLPALAIASPVPTVLERSPAFRVYERRYEDGTRFLNSANPASDD